MTSLILIRPLLSKQKKLIFIIFFLSKYHLKSRMSTKGLVSLNGIAHIQITASKLRWNDTIKFYRELLHNCFGMTILFDNDTTFYCIGGRTGYAISKCKDDSLWNNTFNQQNIGLHHVCFRLKSEKEVDTVYDFLRNNANINDLKYPIKFIHSPEYGKWASGYYSILFEDCDGIRLECNYVPGHGWLDKNKADMLPVTGPNSRL